MSSSCRFNFSHGDHAAHQAVFDRLKGIAAAKDSFVAFMLDTKGPEVRTAMLRDGKDIELVAGQEVTLVACGDDYVTWEGFKDEATGEWTPSCWGFLGRQGTCCRQCKCG